MRRTFAVIVWISVSRSVEGQQDFRNGTLLIAQREDYSRTFTRQRSAPALRSRRYAGIFYEYFVAPDPNSSHSRPSRKVSGVPLLKIPAVGAEISTGFWGGTLRGSYAVTATIDLSLG